MASVHSGEMTRHSRNEQDWYDSTKKRWLFVSTYSGKLPGYQCEGDTLVVWKLDRLGRSVKQLVDLVGELHKQSVQ